MTRPQPAAGIHLILRVAGTPRICEMSDREV